MKKIYNLTFLFLLVAFIGSGLNSFAYNVTFTVEDAEGTPITDAVITFDGTTYASGEYVITALDGDYNYSVEKAGYVTDDNSITINGADEAITSVLLMPIVINTQPVSNIICEGTTTDLTIDAVANNGETLTYAWYLDTEVIVGEEAATLTVDVAGDYYCVLTAGTDELTSETATITIPEVTPVLEAEITACDGTTVTLNPGTFTDYDWSDMTEESTLDVTTTDTYSVTVTDENGCTAMAESVVTFITDINIPFEDTTYICDGTTLTLEAPAGDVYEWGAGEDTQTIEVTEEGWYYLTVTIATCTGNDSIFVEIMELPEEFDLGDELVSCIDTAEIFAPDVDDVDFLWTTDSTTNSIEVTVDGIYGLTLINENGCERYDDVNVTFGTEIEVSLHISDTIYECEGNTITLDPEISGTYEWSTNQSTPTIIVGINDWYNVTVTNDYECQGIDSVFVNFYEIPSIDLGDDPVFCSDTEITVTAPESEVYEWSNDEITQSITISESGWYFCTITDENGCQNSDTIEVTVHQIPSADLGEDVTINNNVSFLLEVNAGEYQYLWSTDETTSHILVDASTLPIGENNFSVTVTNIYGCVNNDEITVTVNQGNSVGQNIAESISLTPNPTQGLFKVTTDNVQDIFIYDNIGKLVLTTKNKEIDMSQYPNGMYFVKIYSNNQTITKKLIKQ